MLLLNEITDQDTRELYKIHGAAALMDLFASVGNTDISLQLVYAWGLTKNLKFLTNSNTSYMYLTISIFRPYGLNELHLRSRSEMFCTNRFPIATPTKYTMNEISISS